MLFSITMLPPVAISFIYDDGARSSFMLAFGVTFITGLVCWLPVHRSRRELRLRDGFMVVVLFWTVLGLFGALPFALYDDLGMSFTDAAFESISGLTTTGATVMTGLDHLPHSILYYRQQLQWLGGMGIIVLAVAILPMLGIGGMQLYRAETPGPMKDSKLTPRITETAKALWYIYLGLTVICALALWLAGMTGFDAIAHSFSAMSIGGFSTHDASIGFYDDALIEIIVVIFMLLAGMNFALHFVAWRGFSIMPYFRDSEAKFYVALLLLVSIFTAVYLYLSSTIEGAGEALHHAIFQTVSIGTTTGLTTTGYSSWPGMLPVLLLLISFIGGCAGSTGGGIKVIRFLLLIKQGMREITRLVHPSAQIPVKIGGKAMSDRVINAVWGFFAVYVALFIIMMLILMAIGMDQITAFSAVAACMNNMGVGLGDVADNFGGVTDVGKWVLCFAMLLGRLEIFTLLVLLTPTFWRK